MAVEAAEALSVSQIGGERVEHVLLLCEDKQLFSV